ncbi:21452_t:CDS:1, partial [Cetraspora pellucida]
EHIQYYYSKWSGRLPKSILQKLELYHQKKSLFNTTSSRQFGNDVIGY